MRPSLHIASTHRRKTAGFSLIECALALGVVSFEFLAPLGAYQKFLPGVVASDNDAFSTLLSETSRPRQTGDVEDLPNDPKTPDKAIRFRPTGGAELSGYANSNDNWFLTIKNERDPSATATRRRLTKHHADRPVTGSARQFRP